MIFGEGFNIMDMVANEIGIITQQDGTSESEALPYFNQMAPYISSQGDVLVKVVPIPGAGTVILIIDDGEVTNVFYFR